MTIYENVLEGAVCAAVLGLLTLLASIDRRVTKCMLYGLVGGLLVANKSFALLQFRGVYISDCLIALTVIAGIGAARNPFPTSAHRHFVMGLGLFVGIGVVALMRGLDFGLAALQDSVITAYSIAALIPMLLFRSAEELARFLKSLWLPLAIGSLAFLTYRSPTAEGSGLLMTAATAAPLAATGILIVLALSERVRSRELAFNALLLAVVVVAGARSVWLGLAAALAFVAVQTTGTTQILRKTFAPAVIVAVAVALGAVSGAAESLLPSAEAKSLLLDTSGVASDPVRTAQWRLDVWEHTWTEKVAASPLFGHGFGPSPLEGTPFFNSDDPRVQVHNAFLTLLLREGVAGLLSFAFLVGLALRECVRAVNRGTVLQRRLGLALAGAVVLYLVDAAFAVVLEGPMGAIPFWLLVGSCFVLTRPPIVAMRTPPRLAPS